GHLTDLEELHEARIADYKNKAETLRSADMSNKKTNEADHNSSSIKILLNDFRKSRIQFLEHLNSLNESELSHSAIHPRLNIPMRLVDMAFFVAEHDDQHLVSVNDILGKHSISKS